jgi:hypothetical protein
MTGKHRELIELLVTAALHAKPIPQAQKIADLLRSWGYGDFADRVSRGIDSELKIIPE